MDTIRMGLPGVGVMDKLNPSHHGPIFTPVDLVKHYLEPLLKGLDVPKDTRLQILKVVQAAHDETS